MLTTAQVYDALQQVQDPEIPVLSVIDLGMITGVSFDEVHTLHIKMIPTYAACPAVNFIRNKIKDDLAAILNCDVKIEVHIDKTINWNSNMLGETAKEKLRTFGIAAPRTIDHTREMEYFDGTPCPHCTSENTVLKTPFGSTLCRAIHYCNNCKQAFEHFKPIV
jgi:ring-1,2-phenylacetyl-CoA epoxidase subunit PaaD